MMNFKNLSLSANGGSGYIHLLVSLHKTLTLSPMELRE